MIKIGKPYVREADGKAFLAARIVDEKRNLDSEMWYSVDAKYRSALCADSDDAFLIALLPLAIRLHEDIMCDSAISRKLNFHLKNTVIPLFAKFWKGCSPIEISASTFHETLPAVSGGGL